MRLLWTRLEPLILLSVLAAPFVLLLLHWTHGNSLAGTIPISDAAGYNSCLRGLSLFGHLPENQTSWCLRRPFYVLLMYPIYSFFGLKLFLVLQNALWVFSILVLRRSLCLYLSRATILFLTLILMLSWTTFAATQTMTEGLAITISILSLAIFLRHLVSRTFLTAFSSLFLLSLSQILRPGNIFLLIAIGIFLAYNYRLRIIQASILLFASASWTLLTYVIQILRSDNVFGNSSNFSAVLYGLTVGNRTYAAAYSDFPPGLEISESAYFQQIRSHAFFEMQHNPNVFLESLLKNAFHYCLNLGPFSPVSPSIIRELLPIQFSSHFFLGVKVILLISILAFLVARQNLRKALLRVDQKTAGEESSLQLKGIFLVVTVSSVLASSLLWADDGFRVLSPNLPWTLTIALMAYQRYFSCKVLQVDSVIISDRKRESIAYALILLLFLCGHTIRLNNSLNAESLASVNFPKCNTGGEARLLVHKEALILTTPVYKIPRIFWYSSEIESLNKGVVVSAAFLTNEGKTEDRTLYFELQTVKDLAKADFVCIDGLVPSKPGFSLGWEKAYVVS